MMERRMGLTGEESDHKVAGIFGAIGGGLFGGLVTMRPDHTPYIARVRAALDDKRHVLVIHAAEREQLKAVRQCVERRADETVATL